MRIRDVLYAFAFRGAARVTRGGDDARRIRIFANSLLTLFRRGGGRAFGTEPGRWAEEVHSLYPNSPPLTAVKKVWEKSRGGCSYRDVYDCLEESLKHEEECPEATFMLFATAVRFLSIVVGGKAAAEAAKALRKAMYRHVPSDMEVDTDSLIRMANRHGAKNADTLTMVRRYCAIQEYRIRLEKQNINAGIFNHFAQWLAKRMGGNAPPQPPKVSRMSTDDLVSAMMQVEDMSRQYVMECSAHYQTSEKGNRMLEKVLHHTMELWP
jgi:hypothetical protein